MPRFFFPKAPRDQMRHVPGRKTASGDDEQSPLGLSMNADMEGSPFGRGDFRSMLKSATPALGTTEDPDIEREHRRRIATAANLALDGKINSIVEVSLSNGTETEIVDGRIHPDCVLLFDPLDEDAEQIMREGPFRVDLTDRKVGSCVLTHNFGFRNARFRMVILG